MLRESGPKPNAQGRQANRAAKSGYLYTMYENFRLYQNLWQSQVQSGENQRPFDDTQVDLCYQVGAGKEQKYLRTGLVWKKERGETGKEETLWHM